MNSTQDTKYFKLKPDAASVKLSYLINNNAELKKAVNLHWAACRVVHYKNHYVDPGTRQWDTDTATYSG